MHAAIVPIAAGGVAIPIGSYLAGRENAVIEFSTTSVLLASLALTVLASLDLADAEGVDGLRQGRGGEPADHRLRPAAGLLRAP